MQVGDLVFSRSVRSIGIILFIDGDSGGFVILYAGCDDWSWGCPEDLDVVCR